MLCYVDSLLHVPVAHSPEDPLLKDLHRPSM